MSERYRNSEEYLERALRSIPLGSQTFSKSMTQFSRGSSPFFINKGDGAYVWDLDGNQYIDFINGLLCVLLGYCDPDVDFAVTEKIKTGVSYSLAHPIETEVAELLIELIPCAEMVRFGKNGSDATSAAIRLSRAHTGRDHVAVCGYHGWQDWYIGSTARNLGVPKSTQELTHTFTYNNLESLKKIFDDYPKGVAAVIMEPMNVEFPQPGFLEKVKDLAHSHGSVLIFDETITGFRFSNGGAQELFGVTPDLATFGKGLGNGYPISAVVGNKDIMLLMEKIFYSGTFGGETISLSAAKAVLTKLKQEKPLQKMHALGQHLIDGLNSLIEKYGCSDFLSVSGHPSWSFFTISDSEFYSSWELHTLFQQEMFARGILTTGSHNLSLSHTMNHIEVLLSSYEDVIKILVDCCKKRNLERFLKTKPLEPLFKVRGK